MYELGDLALSNVQNDDVLMFDASILPNGKWTNKPFPTFSQYLTQTTGDARYSLLGHKHTKSEITDFAHSHAKTDITDFAHTHTISDITSLQDALNLKLPISIYTAHKSNKYPEKHVTADNLNVLSHLSIVNGALQTDIDFYSTGGVSAYGYGASGGSGGGSTVVWETESAGAVPLTVEGVTKTLSLSTHSHTKSQITDFVHTHLWTDLTDKPTSFTPSSHIHSISDISTLQDALNAKLNTSVFNDMFVKEVIDGVSFIKANYNFYSTGGVSAYGIGVVGSGGGGGTMVTWGTEANDSVQLIVESVSKSLSLASHTHSGYALNSSLSNYVPTSRTINPGNGLTGGGNLSADRTLTLGTPSSITNTSTNSVTTTSHTHLLSMGSGSGLDADTVDGKHVAALGHWDKIPLIGADGVMEVGMYIDFHEVNTGGPDYAGRLSSYSGSPLWSGNAMYHSGNSNRTDMDWTAKTLIVETDITTNFKTWTHGSSKSLKKFLELFDIDTAGNLVVGTNLYSTGEVTAYSTGTGVSGLTLQGDMNANGKNINNLTSISKLDSKIRLLGSSIAFDIDGYDNQLTIADDGIYANTSIEAIDLLLSGTAQATEFKFGLWSFKEVSGNMVIYYNDTAKATIQSVRTNSNL